MTSQSVSLTQMNAITIDLKTQSIAEIYDLITALPSVHSAYSVSIVNRRLNEKHFRAICKLLKSMGLVNLDMTYDIWAKDLYVVQDTKTLRTIGIPFNTEISAQNWLLDTFKSTKPVGTTQKQEDKAYASFKECYRVVHTNTIK